MRNTLIICLAYLLMIAPGCRARLSSGLHSDGRMSNHEAIPSAETKKSIREAHRSMNLIFEHRKMSWQTADGKPLTAKQAEKRVLTSNKDVYLVYNERDYEDVLMLGMGISDIYRGEKLEDHQVMVSTSLWKRNQDGKRGEFIASARKMLKFDRDQLTMNYKLKSILNDLVYDMYEQVRFGLGDRLAFSAIGVMVLAVTVFLGFILLLVLVLIVQGDIFKLGVWKSLAEYLPGLGQAGLLVAFISSLIVGINSMIHYKKPPFVAFPWFCCEEKF